MGGDRWAGYKGLSAGVTVFQPGSCCSTHLQLRSAMPREGVRSGSQDFCADIQGPLEVQSSLFTGSHHHVGVLLEMSQQDPRWTCSEHVGLPRTPALRLWW
jgi:hypothetical protein